MLHIEPKYLEILFWGLVGGFAYRTRGGLLDKAVGRVLRKPIGWEIPNQYIRAVWGVAVFLCLWNFTGLFCNSLFIGVLGFVGTLPGYFNAEFDLSNPANWNWRNYLRLSLRGMFTCLPSAAYATYMHGMDVTAQALWCGVVAGLVFVPVYLSGKYLHHIIKEQIQSQWGEWQLGFCTLAIVAGRFII